MDSSEQKNIKQSWWNSSWLLVVVGFLLIVGVVCALVFSYKKDEPALTGSKKVLTDEQRAEIENRLSASTTLKESDRAEVEKKFSATTQLSDVEKDSIVNRLSN